MDSQAGSLRGVRRPLPTGTDETTGRNGSGAAQVVESMRLGMGPGAAAEDAMRRIMDAAPPFQGALVALDARGNHGAAAFGWVFRYAVASAAHSGEPQVHVVQPLTHASRTHGGVDVGEDAGESALQREAAVGEARRRPDCASASLRV